MVDGVKKNLNDKGTVSGPAAVVSNGVSSLGNGGFVGSSVAKVPETLKNGTGIVTHPSQALESSNGVAGAIFGQSDVNGASFQGDLKQSSQSYYRQRAFSTAPSPVTPNPALKSTSLSAAQIIGSSKSGLSIASSQQRDAARNAEIKRLLSRKRPRTEEDNRIEESNRQRFKKAIASDHELVLRPDIETAFVDAADVVRRLLPYHVFQHPQDELKYAVEKGNNSIRLSAKGKEKETPLSEADRETEELNLALDLHKQKRALETRFREIRIREAKNSSPLDQVVWLTQAMLDSDREANAELSNQLRDARLEHERKEREKQMASQPKSASLATTPITSRPSYSFPTPHPYNSMAAYTSAAYQSYYQSYLASMSTMSNLTPGEIQARAALYTQGRIPYGHGISAAAPYSYANYFATAFPASGTPGGTVPPATAVNPTSTVPGTPTSTTSFTPANVTGTPAGVPQTPTPNTNNTAPDTPFPVSIPATELNALHQLGIYPVATSSLPPNTPEPAAVFVGLSADGTMINMTINLSKLEPSQRGGLAKFLSGLVKNEKGTASAG